MYQEDGVLGSAQVRGRLTLVLDVFRLVDRMDSAPARAAAAAGKKRRRAAGGGHAVLPLAGQGVSGRPGLRRGDRQPSAPRAWRCWSAETFDLVVSDIEMPVMDGWTFARSMRQRPHLRDLPLLALTTLSSAADQERALQCGFNSYEVKLDRDRLLADGQAVVAKLSGQGEAPAEPEVQARQEPRPPWARPRL